MITYEDINTLVGVGIGVISVGSILLGVLAWVGNKMYDKLMSMETLFMTHLTLWSDKFSSLDNRVSRLEVRIDNMKDMCALRHPKPPKDQHNDYIPR